MPSDTPPEPGQHWINVYTGEVVEILRVEPVHIGPREATTLVVVYVNGLLCKEERRHNLYGINDTPPWHTCWRFSTNPIAAKKE